MWGQVVGSANILRWFPAQYYEFKWTPSKPRPSFKPYMAPGLKAVPRAEFPPIPAFKDRHLYGLKPPEKPLLRDDPTETPREYPDKKMKMPKALVLAMEAAFAGTELVDLVDNMWSELPKRYRNVPMTGICTRGCRNPGTRYHSTWDKAGAIRDAWPHLPGDVVAKMLARIAVNQATDAVMGRFFKKVDEARRRAGGSGWGFVTG